MCSFRAITFFWIEKRKNALLFYFLGSYERFETKLSENGYNLKKFKHFKVLEKIKTSNEFLNIKSGFRRKIFAQFCRSRSLEYCKAQDCQI